MAKIHQKMNDEEKALYYAQKAYEYNRQLVNGKSKDFDFTQDEFNMILFGLHIASIFKNKEHINYFLSRVPMIENQKEEHAALGNVFKLVAENAPVPSEQIDKFNKAVKDDNIDVVFSMLENYAVPQSKLEILRKMDSKFHPNPAYLNALGLAMMENNFRKEASMVLKKSIEFGYKDATSMIKLISLCVLEGDKLGAEQALALADAEYGTFIPEKIAKIRQKLNNLR
jgi:hypothetical protein